MAAWTFSSLYGEVINRGFSWANDAGTQLSRVKRFVNDSMWEIDRLEKWDYRRTTATGAAPLTVSTLGEIEAVTYGSGSALQVLEPSSLAELVETWGDLTTTGTPESYYLSAGVINVYPVGTSSLTVSYLRISPELSGDSDAPLMPDQFRYAIVERACAKAYRDQDDPEMAAVCLGESDRLVDQMREFYAMQAGVSHVIAYGYSDDW